MAGFWAGFGEQMSTNIEQRQKTLDRLIEENLDNARLAKQNYAKRKGAADSVLSSAKAIRDKFGLNDAQVLALAEGYGADLPTLQLNLDKQQAQLKSAAGSDLTPTTIMSYVNAAENLSLPKGMTLEQGVNKLMGLHAQELAKEAQPKSEGAQTRSFIRAAMAYDPQLQAADKMQDIKGPNGLSYAQLLEMQEAGFAPDQVYGDVTRAGGITLDYTTSTAKQTRSDYAKSLSTKLFQGNDYTNDIVWNNLSGKDKSDKASLRAAALGAGEAMARLERDIVVTFQGQDLGMSALRKGVLDDIYNRIESPEELELLRKNVYNGKAIELIQERNGKLTDDDIDTIILGGEAKDEGDGPIVVGQGSGTGVEAGVETGAETGVEAGVETGTGASGGTDGVSAIVADLMGKDPADINVQENTPLGGRGSETEVLPDINVQENTPLGGRGYEAMMDASPEQRLAAKKATTESIIEGAGGAAEVVSGAAQDVTQRTGRAITGVVKAVNDYAVENALEGSAFVNTTLGGLAQALGADGLADFFYKGAIANEDGAEEVSDKGWAKAALEKIESSDVPESVSAILKTVITGAKENVTAEKTNADAVSSFASYLEDKLTSEAEPVEEVEEPTGLMSSPRPRGRPANLGKVVDIDLIKTLHGSGSKVADTWEEKSNLSREDLKVSEVTRLIKDTQALPKTDARSTLLESLYDLRDVMNNRK